MRKNILDYLFWIFLIIALGYVILKITGLINTPEWVSYIPIVSIIFAAGAAYGSLIGSVNKINARTIYLKDKTDSIESKVVDNRSRIQSLENGQKDIFDILNNRKRL